MTSIQPHTLSATGALQKIGDGLLTSVDLVKSCLDRINETDGQLKAWAHVDGDPALARAEEMDAMRRAGRSLGLLHGLPVGLKDVIDTKDMPTERGTPIFAGRQPDADAALVERLLEAGAVILGKTVTTELAFMHPSETRNPHDQQRTPGGSSSGSAAAVAAFQVPLAVGTQTGGSVIRPASFCGTFGFKPTRGVISRRGVLRTSETLDQIGVFSRTLQDSALLADVLGGYDPLDPASFARPRPKMREGCLADVPVEPNLALFDLPYDNRMAPQAREGLAELADALGKQVERIPAPAAFAGLVDAQQIIQEHEISRNLGRVFEENWDRLSSSLQPAVERGRAVTSAQYEDALERKARAAEYFDAFFKDFDAVITLGAPGEAPPLSDGVTGDPVFCTIWTLAGLPAVTMPLLVGGNGLPIGVQLVGAVEEDDRLLRTANRVLNFLQSDAN